MNKEKSWGKTLRKRKKEKEIATARAIIEEYRQKNGKLLTDIIGTNRTFSISGVE